MKNFVLVYLVVFILVSPTFAYAGHAPAPAVSITDIVKSVDSGITNAEEPQPVKGPIIRIIKRRRLGATFWNIKRILEEMKSNGELGDYVSEGVSGGQEINASALAVTIAQRLKAENPGSWWDNIDWEQLFAFLERLIELILDLIGPFLTTFNDSGQAQDQLALSNSHLALAA